MKRVITLLMAAVMVIGTAGLASAVEFNVSGHMHIIMGGQDNGSIDASRGNFDKDVKEDNFYAAQRFRPKLTVTAEGVTMVFEAQQHQMLWGEANPGLRVGGNPDAQVRVRQAYIDFELPGTPVSLKTGYQQLNLPSIWGHPVFEARVGGVVATIPFTDEVALAAFYARPWQNNAGDKSYNSVDMYGLLLPLDFGTVKATPYFVYARTGLDSGIAGLSIPAEYSNVYVGGVNLEIAAADALTVKLDGIVTSVNNGGDLKGEADAGLGFMVAVAVDYEMPFGTPGIFGWYATGPDDKGEGGLASFQTDGFGPTSLGYEGYNTFWNGAWIGSTGASTWAIGAQIADMSFVDSLKHTLRVAYIQGTGDKDYQAGGGAGLFEYWSEDDSFIEVNFDSTWSIYENLAAVFELGCLVPDFKNGTDDFAYRGQVTLRFSF